ncbi:MAG TPA: GNAT family N-acetyltransferase [Burkholderiales bacterium]|nr:GNAT family N-acetyltransferase [Burkholderiales bacterium]
MEIRIRDAIAEDLPAVLTLLKQLDVGHDRPFLPAEAQRIFERLQSCPHHHLYVAVAQARIVGTFVLILIDSIAHGGMPHGLVEDVVVDPAWQGHGIGKQMMQFAMERCRDAGCYKMALSSHLSREKTHRFYESLGFEKHGFSFLIR